MKHFLTILIILCFVACTSADTVKVEKLQAEIQRLNRQITELQKTVKLQKLEIERLKSLCLNAGIDVIPKKKIKKPTQEAIGQPIFGIFLGETIDSLTQRLWVSKDTYTFEDKDHPGKICTVQNLNQSVKELLVRTFNDQIYAIDIKFEDGSRMNYEAIKGQLEKKYKSEDKGGITGALFGEGVFEPVINGVKIRIELNHDTGFGEDDKLELSYTHTTLRKKVYEEIQRKKATKISSEL